MESRNEIGQPTENKDDVMEVESVCSVMNTEENIGNNEMDALPEIQGDAGMDTENESRGATPSNIEMKPDNETFDDSGMENFEIQQNEESQEAVMENEELIKDVEMFEGEELDVSITEKVEDNINTEEVSVVDDTSKTKSVDNADIITEQISVADKTNNTEEAGVEDINTEQVGQADDFGNADQVSVEGNTNNTEQADVADDTYKTEQVSVADETSSTGEVNVADGASNTDQVTVADVSMYNDEVKEIAEESNETTTDLNITNVESAVDESEGELKITQVESIREEGQENKEEIFPLETGVNESEDKKDGKNDSTVEENIEKENTENQETNKDVGGAKDKKEDSNQDQTKKDVEKSKDDDDVQIIDLDDSDNEKDGDKTIKQESGNLAEAKTDGLGLQIASVSGATDIPKETTAKVKAEVKQEHKPVFPVKQEVKQENKPDLKSQKNKIQTCIVCKKTGKCKYNIVRNGDVKHLCDDECFKRFRSNPTTFLRAQSPPQHENKAVAPITNQHGQYKTCQVCQIMNINASSSKPFLNWQGMDFCGEDCLGKFQGSLNTSCSQCSNLIQQANKGKFCLKFGNQIRQFCSQACNNEFTKRQKLCECCQKDISKSSDAFVAAAGTEGSFKDFCSQTCLQKYEEKSSRDVEITGIDSSKRGGVAPKGTHTCSVCSKVSTMKHQVQLEGKSNYLCSDPCFSAFQYANKLTMNTCDNCGVYCYNEGMHPQYIQFEGQQKRFCSFMCVNAFKTLNKKIVSCSWCNCKKSNFDMIERVDANNKYQLFCSLNCLSLYRVNLQATSNQAVMCDQCKRYVPAQYHLTMSDASVRNFCSYNCVMSFQAQFTGTNSATTQPPNASQKGGIQTRSTSRPTQPTPTRPSQPAAAQQKAGPANQVRGPLSAQQNAPRPPVQNRPTNPNMNSIPIISNVVSLAPQGNQQQQVNFKSNQQVPLVINNKNANIRTTVPAQSTQIQQTVIIQPPQPKTVKNKSCLCKPFVQTKATSCRPHTQTKETQTDKDMEPKNVIVPIPIPFYVPVPMAMYSQPTPIAFPFPIPIPIPCFIPTTKKNSNSILKHIKEIREKIPDDPLEAELLMMAEAVSANAKDSSDSEEDKSDVEMDTAEETTVTKINSPSRSDSPEPEKPAELGEDMLQMALRMATEMTSEPVMDLEETIEPVPVNTEPPPKPKPVVEDDDDDDDEEYTPVRETRSKGKGTKRSGGQSRRRSKRQKAPLVVKVAESPAPEEPEPVAEPPPDANLYLKYTYGVNAWKHWVVQKNNQLDKVSKQGSGKLKLFKTDMLQCSADELNYSLCLFVKEVRKPNGEEYAPDSIYYLCLGIQMFLFENERIDNIFTDIYYEKFTECLNEVLQRYTPKLNAAGQIVCRIEEEHLWECKQLGAHSPHVLLNTLVYFNTKYFQLKTPDDHLKLSFTHIMKHWKKATVGKGNNQGRSVYLRYYCPAPVRQTTDGNRKKKEELPVYEQAENLDNPLRCPVKLYEFYLSKCPESIKNRSDAFYLVPERSCVPDSPVWYSTQNLQIEAMNKMLNRTLLVREIQESFIHTQPVYAS